jgi:ubiquinone/menaquinone biosynthesis C-methylase UbiE
MAESDRVFAGSIPEIYDRLMVPMIFNPYANDLAERIARLEPANVLETAAGTGALTRAIAARLPASAWITATDLNQPMLDRAKASLSGDQRITWQQADALSLPFGDQQFDAVACQFGVMFFPDRPRGYREAGRVLKPGGSFLFDTWERLSRNEFVTIASEELLQIFPDDPPVFMERTPHGYYETDLIRRDLEAAGFQSIGIETIEHTARAATALEAATAYCQGTPLRGEIETRAPGRLQHITERVALALERRFGTGPIEGRIAAHVVTARG